MKKLFLFAAMLIASALGSDLFAQLDETKTYTIVNNNDANMFMQDNGTGVVDLNAENENSYWKFVPTSNTDCYYIQNTVTGKYIQGYTATEQEVATGDTGVEYYVKADATGTYAGKYRMSCTANSPHDFSAGTLGLNWKTNGDVHTVQSFASVAEGNPRSAWTLTVVATPTPDPGTDPTWDEPAQVDGVYQIGTASELEWYAEYVNSCVDGETESNNAKLMSKAVLTADIDLTGITHSPIGESTQFKFDGEFDGQHHRIKNMIINNTLENQGFFGCVRGNAIIKNIIIDKSCSITAGNRAAGLIGTLQTAADGKCRILNCVNEANVTSTSGVASGIIGAGQSGYAFFKIHNCVNTGKITGASTNKAAAFNGWGADSGKGNSQVWNCYNLGELSPLDGTNTFFRGSFRSVQNCYDAVNEGGQGTKISAEDVANGRLCYLLNQGETEGISFKQTIGVDPYPMPVADGAVVYQVADLDCAGNPKGDVTYSNTDGGSQDDHNYDNGICSVCNGYQEPNLVDGWYELTNAGNVEWFSEQVKNGGGAAFYAKLMNDIDFEKVVNLHSPIGPTTGAKFKGEFDGQGHRIMNMIINRPESEAQGFFGWLQGNSNTTIKNLIIDASCSITGQNKCGGLAGASQNKSDVAKITIENIVNEADVTVSGQDAAGIVGGESGDKATYYVHNVVNTGTITSTHQYPYAGALFCFQEKGTVKNFLNLGTIVGHRGGNLGRFNGTWENVVDLSDTNMSETVDGTNRGIIAELTTADIASGKLAYYINDKAEENAFYQLIGTDAYPMPFAKEGATVYQNGNYSCPNTVESLAYSNTENITGNNTSHTNNTKGFCTFCNEVMPDHISPDADNFLPLSSSDDLVWFSAMVNAGNTTINGKLTADVDMSSVTYTPIGNDANRYHGTFDGSGHKVNLNIDANAYGQGFISIATGGVTVKNLVITGTVKNADSKTAGIIAEAIGGGVVTIQNCGNEATIQGTNGETAAIIANNWGYQCTLNIENVYNIGSVSGVGDVSTICACQGNSSSVFKNVYNSGSVTGATQGNFVRTSNGTYTNCYSTTLSDNDNTNIISTNASAVESGELCAKLGFGFRQNLSSDTYPNFTSDHGFVAQIGAAGYSTMYNVYSDVEIPSGIEAYAGVVNGTSLSLVAIENKIAASEPVVLKLAEGADAGLFNFMPTTGASKAASNSLSGSNGRVTGGDGTYALAQKGDPAVVGFYPVAASVTIPEGKAYLEYTGSNPVKVFTFEDDATAIEMVNGQSSLMVNGPIFNLAGQRMSKMQKGINIVNGKKIAVK